jgi:hypothetical protein
MSDRPSQEAIERDIKFEDVISMIRVSDRRDAADLLHAALRVAFNNGEVFGMESMAKIADNAFATATTSASSRID